MNQASLDLLPRKEFQLTLDDGTIVKGQFGTWALARFGQKKKLGLSGILDVFNDSPQIMDMIEFIICAIEYKERQAGVQPFINEIRLSKWVDDYADASGEIGVLTKLFNHSAGENTEKKNIPAQESSPNGMSLSEHSVQPEVV